MNCTPIKFSRLRLRERGDEKVSRPALDGEPPEHRASPARWRRCVMPVSFDRNPNHERQDV
jgi:hypothetical protein